MKEGRKERGLLNKRDFIYIIHRPCFGMKWEIRFGEVVCSFLICSLMMKDGRRKKEGRRGKGRGKR